MIGNPVEICDDLLLLPLVEPIDQLSRQRFGGRPSVRFSISCGFASRLSSIGLYEILLLSLHLLTRPCFVSHPVCLVRNVDMQLSHQPWRPSRCLVCHFFRFLQAGYHSSHLDEILLLPLRLLMEPVFHPPCLLLL